VTAGGPYVWPLDAVIRAFKFRGVMSLAPPLATLVAEAVGSPPPRAILVPVPLAPARARARGFNPAAEVARSLAGALDLRWDPDLLVRVRDTRAQSSLPRAGRAANVAGAFAARRHPGPGPVVLVDDVLTTGATAAAAARALIDAGAIDLRTWVVARARPRGDHRTGAPPAPTDGR
jgi:ComF family protein